MNQFVRKTPIHKLKTRMNKERYWLTLYLSCFVIIVLAIAFYMPSQNLKFEFGQVTALNNQWQLTYPSGEAVLVDLPVDVDLPVNRQLIIEKELRDDFSMPQTLRLRSSMQQFSVYLDQEEIYTNLATQRHGFFYQPQASAWHLIDLPANSDHKQLEIHIASQVKAMSGLTNGIYYGHRSDLIGQLIADQPIGIGIAIMIIVIGFLANIVSWVVHVDNINRLNYLSIFTLAIGTWLVSEMDIMQMFTGNNYIVGAISYLVLPIAGIAFLLFLKEVVLTKYAKVILAFVGLIALYLPISIFLQLTMNLHYFNAFIVFNPMLLIAVVLVYVLLVYEGLWCHNSDARKYLMFLGVMVVTVAFEVIKFLIGDFMDISYLSSLGVGLFLTLLIIDTLKYVNSVLQIEEQTKYLEEIAYKDILTGGLNRSAFEKKVDELLGQGHHRPFRLVMFDLNNLKQINDQHGHNSGDRALKDFYECLVEAFKEKSICYRVGGDEFMVIQTTASEILYNKALTSLEKQMKEIEAQSDYLFSCAYGEGIYEYDRSFGEFKHEVDMKMYRLKEAQKEKQEEKQNILITKTDYV